MRRMPAASSADLPSPISVPSIASAPPTSEPRICTRPLISPPPRKMPFSISDRSAMIEPSIVHEWMPSRLSLASRRSSGAAIAAALKPRMPEEQRLLDRRSPRDRGSRR